MLSCEQEVWFGVVYSPFGYRSCWDLVATFPRLCFLSQGLILETTKTVGYLASFYNTPLKTKLESSQNGCLTRAFLFQLIHGRAGFGWLGD